MCIDSRKEELLRKNESGEAYLFNNLYDLVLCFFPKKIHTSKREFVKYDEMKGVIGDLGDIADDASEMTWELNASSLLQQLCHVVMIVSHKIGLLYDTVEPEMINREYVRYYFEEKTIKRHQAALKEDATKDEIEDMEVAFDADEVRKYCIRNKVKWYLDMIESKISHS